MRAALPMYDVPELREVTDRFWTQVRDALRARELAAPDHLDRETYGDALWRAPDLVLSQTCGLPYRSRLHGKVQLVGTADHNLPGCAPGTYNSVVIKRRDDARATLAAFTAARVAINEFGSQSGFAALANDPEAPATLRDDTMITGSHAASAAAVAQGEADYAALDAVTWTLLQRYSTVASTLYVFHQTAPTPALPYICANDVDAALVRGALDQAVAALSHTDQEALCLFGIVHVPAEAYLAVPTP